MIKINVDDTLQNSDWTKPLHRHHEAPSLTKARVYLKPGQTAPQGRSVEAGPRGGRYYETKRETGSVSAAPSSGKREDSVPVWERKSDPDFWIDEATPDDFAEFFHFEDLFAVCAVDRIDDDGDEMGMAVVNVGLFNSSGVQVAAGIRQFEAGGNVNNAVFEVDPAFQASGFGTRFSEEMERRYMAAGFNTVTLTADIDVGKYIWALIGYDFNEGYDPKDLLIDLQHFVANSMYLEEVGGDHPIEYRPKKVTSWGLALRSTGQRGARDYFTEYMIKAREWIESLGPNALAHSWDFAALDDGKEHDWVTQSRSGKGRLGKAFLLYAGAWDGIKHLDPKSEGFRVGKAYYDAKNKSSINKARKYLKPGEEPPKGVEVEIGQRGGRYYETKPNPNDIYMGQDLPDWANDYDVKGLTYKEWEAYLERGQSFIDTAISRAEVQGRGYGESEIQRLAVRRIGSLVQEQDFRQNTSNSLSREKAMAVATMLAGVKFLEEHGENPSDWMPATFLKKMGIDLPGFMRITSEMALLARSIPYQLGWPHEPEALAQVIKTFRNHMKDMLEYPAFHIWKINVFSDRAPEGNVMGYVALHMNDRYVGKGEDPAMGATFFSIVSEREMEAKKSKPNVEPPYKEDENGRYATTSAMSYDHVVRHELIHVITTKRMMQDRDLEGEFGNVLSNAGVGLGTTAFRNMFGSYGMRDPQEAIAQVGAHITLGTADVPPLLEEWFRKRILLEGTQVSEDGTFEFNGRRFKKTEFPE